MALFSPVLSRLAELPRSLASGLVVRAVGCEPGAERRARPWVAGCVCLLLAGVGCGDPHAEARALVETAQQQVAAGQLRDAERALDQAAALAPTSADLQFRIGEALAALGSGQAAIAAFEKTVALQPSHARAHLRLAQSWSRRENFGKAMAHARRAAASDSTDAEALHTLGLLQAREGDLGQAIHTFQAAVRADPIRGVAWYHLGEAYLKSGDAAAEEAFRRALDTDPGSAMYQEGMGQVLSRRREHEAAIRHFEQAVAADSLYARAHFGLGNAYLRVGQRERGRQALERHRLLTAQDQRIVGLLDAIAQRADGVTAYHDLAVLYGRRGQTSLAARYYELAIRTDPTYAPAYVNLGNMHLRRLRLEQASELFAKALAADSAYALVHAAMGNLRMLQGRYNEGLGSFERAVELSPDDASLQRTLATAREVASPETKAAR